MSHHVDPFLGTTSYVVKNIFAIHSMDVFNVLSYSSQYRSEPQKPRVNTKTIGPIGHPGEPTKGIGGKSFGGFGFRKFDMSEYEDSRKYGPAKQEYGLEYPRPDRSKQYTASQEYRPKEYRPEYPPPDRV